MAILFAHRGWTKGRRELSFQPCPEIYSWNGAEAEDSGGRSAQEIGCTGFRDLPPPLSFWS